MALATLLAVEDDATHRFVLERICNKFDYELHTFSSGEEAFAAITMVRYAAVLMDLGLPGISGIECTRRIRQFEQSRGLAPVPVIALTASINVRDFDACMEAGMNDFLSKPFQPENLRKILLRWVYQPLRPNLKILQGSEESLDESDLYAGPQDNASRASD